MLWEGLPTSQCSWEPASSLDFDVDEFTESLPDLTGCHQADIERVLSVTGAESIQHSRNVKKFTKRPAQSPVPSCQHLKRQCSIPAAILPTIGASKPFAVTAEDNWWDFLPTLNIVDGAEVELTATGALFDSQIPDSPERTTFDKELCCLISPKWLTDTPINNLGACIGDPNTVRPPEFQKIYYILSFYSNSHLHLQQDLGTVDTYQWKAFDNISEANLFLTAYNDNNVHWFAAVYSRRFSTWLILDSIRRSDAHYTAPIHQCHTALQQHARIQTDSQTVQFVVCADWPQQGNGFDCGVYTCIALMFVAKHSEQDGIIEKMMCGNQFNFTPPPGNLCREFRRDIFKFSKVTLEPYMPHFRYEIVRPTM